MSAHPPTSGNLLDADIARHREDMPDAMLDSLFEQVAGATVDRAPTPRDRLRELPTPIRVALGFAGVIGMGLMLVIMMGVRPELSNTEALTFGLPAAAMLGLSLLAVVLALRGTHRRPLSLFGWLGVGISLLGPLAFAALPGQWHGTELPATAMMNVMCLVVGSMGAFGCAGIVLLFSRSDRNPMWRLMLAAGAGGMAGFVFQTAHCPGSDPFHLVASHATYGLVVGGAFAAIAWFRR